MIAAQNLILNVVCVLLTVYTLVLLLRVLLSWAELFGFRRPYGGPMATAISLLHAVTDPVLAPLRNLIPPVRMGMVGLDLSIIIAFVILFVLRTALGC